MAADIQKLSELTQDSNITRETKIPTITSDGNMKYNTIEKLMAKAIVVQNARSIAPKGGISISGVMGVICVSSSLGSALFYFSNYGEFFIPSNDNYTNLYDNGMDSLPSNKINIYFEKASDYVYIENNTNTSLFISVSGFALPYSAISNE